MPFLIALMTAAWVLPSSAQALGETAYEDMCDHSSSIASQEYRVPLSVLKAIARTESGITTKGNFVAWPWTINVEGKGARFASKREALRFFQESFASGTRNIDLGCFQVNYRWHGRNFKSADAMLDPDKNARYAAQFLRQLYDELGDWTAAAGAFHSRTDAHAEKYLARFVPIFVSMAGENEPREPEIGSQSNNTFPLLTNTPGRGVRGSLFPSTAPGRGSLLGNSGVRG